MNALVTGGAGFIGSTVVRELLKNNHKVTVIDNLSSGYAQNLDGLDVEFVKGDILDAKLVERLTEKKDVVFHLAASVGRQRSIDNPVLDAQVNLIGTTNVLQGIRKNGVKRIVYSSSAAIFGELQQTVIDENHPQNADCPYGVTKLSAEKQILAYSHLFGFTAICLRYFNVFGLRQRFDAYGNVIPIFANNAYKNLPLKIYGDGEQTRDFICSKDVAKINYLAGTKQGLTTGVFNLGSGNSITINELAQMILKHVKTDSKIEHVPERIGDVRDCKADITKLKTVMGYTPSTDFEGDLVEYLEWFKQDMDK